MDTRDADLDAVVMPDDRFCVQLNAEGKRCGGWHTQKSPYCIGHQRARGGNFTTAPKLTPKRLAQRLLGRMSRELGRLDIHEGALSEKLALTEGLDERIEILKEMSRLSVRRSEMFDQIKDHEHKRMIALTALIVAGAKANYPTDQLKRLIAVGGVE